MLCVCGHTLTDAVTETGGYCPAVEGDLAVTRVTSLNGILPGDKGAGAFLSLSFLPQRRAKLAGERGGGGRGGEEGAGRWGEVIGEGSRREVCFSVPV